MPDDATTIRACKNESREAEAERALKHTALTPAMAWTLCALFLATVLFEPLLQHGAEIRAGLTARRSTAVGAGAPQRRARILPQVYDVLRLFPSWQAVRQARTPRDVWGLLPSGAALRAFETELEESSVSAGFILPRAQYVLSRFGGVGNEKAYLGHGGWLFYRPEIDDLTGEGFLSVSHLRSQSRSGSDAIQPDPRRAIVQFQRHLARRGIQLIVMPVPSKAMLEPARYTRRYRNRPGVLRNLSFAQFRRDLEAAGVLVFDVADAMAAGRHADAPLYLETDTHWRPETMERAATALTQFISQHVPLPAVASPAYRQMTESVSNLGDIAMMLRLPEGQTLYREQRVTPHPVLNSRGEFWRASRTADVLLLGDSYCNVYSADAMGWGYGAGFPEQLSFAMQRPLDLIARNDAGAFATRQMLTRELARGRDRLAGKRLVIWEFAVRELAGGDWKLLDLTPPDEIDAIRARATHARPFLVVPVGAEALVRGTVDSISAVPRPGSVPYKDHILAIHLTDIESVDRSVASTQALVYMWSMRDGRPAPAARYRPGERLTLRLKAWADVAAEYEAINRSELDGGDVQLEEPNWGEAIGR